MKTFVLVCIAALGLAGCDNIANFDERGEKVKTYVVRDSSDPCEINFYISDSNKFRGKNYRARLITKECKNN